MSSAGRSKKAGTGHQRHLSDYYATPSHVTRAILRRLCIDVPRILEPSAGDGAIVRELLAAGVPADRVRAIEIDPGRAAQVPCVTQCEDFLKCRPWRREDEPWLVIGNPPFSLAQEFVEHSLAIVAPGGTVAMLLRLAFLESQKRASFHREHPADLYVLPRRPSFTGKGTDSAAVAWFLWGPGRGNRWHLLDETQPLPQGSTHSHVGRTPAIRP
jgi:hypothetical protein